MTDDDQLRAWLAAERQSLRAEMAIAQIPEGALHAAELYAEARELRALADLLFHAIYVAARANKVLPTGPAK